MSELYEQDRVQRLSRIQRSFSSAVRTGDQIEFGLRGDPLFPPDYKSSRPQGRVMRVKGVGTDGASIRVRLTNGSVVDVMPYTLDPRRVWEFTDDHFQKVVERNNVASLGTEREDPSYGNAKTVPKSEYDALLQKVELLSTRLDKEVRETKNFNGALVASFSEMADEVRKVSKEDTPFCNKFSTEYRSMVEAGDIKDVKSPFDSDFGSSSDEDNNY